MKYECPPCVVTLSGPHMSVWTRSNRPCARSICPANGRLVIFPFRQDSHVGRSPRLTFSAPDDVNARNLPSEICPRRACHKYVSSLLRSEEHTSELQSQSNLVCRLLLE